MARKRKRSRRSGRSRAKVCAAPSGERRVSVTKVRLRGSTRWAVRAKLGAGDGKPRAKNGGCIAPKRVYGAFGSKAKAEARATKLRNARKLN